MSISRFFDREVVVRRLRTTSGNKQSFQSTATVEGHTQELDERSRQLQGIVEEKAWEAWFFEDAPIQEGDQITDERGTVYQVREIVIKDYGINRHLQVILIEINE